MKKLSFVLVIISLVLVGCKIQNPSAPTANKPKGIWTKDKFDGHVYIISTGTGVSGYGSGIAHDPDCSCQKPK
jgi:hypothetical protein